jgi:hypothetical protein
LPIGKDAAESLMRDRLYATFGVASTKAITPQQMGDLSQQLRDLLEQHSPSLHAGKGPGVGV